MARLARLPFMSLPKQTIPPLCAESQLVAGQYISTLNAFGWTLLVVSEVVIT